jgi:hypothetical protein
MVEYPAPHPSGYNINLNQPQLQPTVRVVGAYLLAKGLINRKSEAAAIRYLIMVSMHGWCVVVLRMHGTDPHSHGGFLGVQRDSLVHFGTPCPLHRKPHNNIHKPCITSLSVLSPAGVPQQALLHEGRDAG